jgi:hypothetical protein
MVKPRILTIVLSRICSLDVDMNIAIEGFSLLYSGRRKFMLLPLKSKILETPGSSVTDDIKMFPL